MRKPAATMRKRLSRVDVALAALGAALAVGAVAWAAESLTVIEKEAAIRKAPRTYSPRVAVVKEGEKVTVLERVPPWIRVRSGASEGWLNESSVTDEDVVLSTSQTARGVRVTEQSAAGRGFTPEVEAKYRKENPSLSAAFRQVDDIEKRKFPEEKIVEFILAGRLAGSAGGGQ